jgi:hypothetical protein
MPTKKTVKGNPDVKNYIREGYDHGDKEMKMPTPAEYRQIRSDELLKEASRHIDHFLTEPHAFTVPGDDAWKEHYKKNQDNKEQN